MLTSPGNARFWLQLCGAGGLEGAGRLAEDFRAAEARGKAELAAFSQAYNRALIERVGAPAWAAPSCSGWCAQQGCACGTQVLGLPGVAGLHIMPLTKPGRSQVLALQAGGTIPQPL